MGRGAAAGAAGVALFVLAALVQGGAPDSDAPAREVADWYGDERTRIQLSAALSAAATPFLVWFLAVAARDAAPVAWGCGLVPVAALAGWIAVASVALAARR